MKSNRLARLARRSSSRNRMSLELLDPRLMLTGSPYDTVTLDIQSGEIETEAYVARPTEGTTQGGQAGKHVAETEITFPEGFSAHHPQDSVFGNDDRDLIGNPTTAPYRRHGSMRMLKTDGDWSFCSGAMVSPFVFMTAGHCVHDGGAGGSWFTNVQVTLARNGDERWYGAANARSMTSVTGWTNNNDPDFDWALIELDRNLGNTTGWNGWWWYSNDNTYNGMDVSIAGYPSDLATQWSQATMSVDTHQIEMYESMGSMLSPTSHQLRYNGTLDTFGGMSGSSVIEDKVGVGRVAVGIHAYGNGGDNSNEATRLREPMSNIISDVVGRTPPTDRPDLIDWDTWFDSNLSFMSTSSVRPGDSFAVTTYPRNNGTASTGNYTVSFYASANTFISSGDYLLGSVSMNDLSPFNWDTATLNTFISDDIPEGTYNIGWIVDSGSSVSEFSENNNRGYIENAQLTINKALPDAWIGGVEGYAYAANQAGGNTVNDSVSFDASMSFLGDVDSYYFAPEVSGTYTFRAFDVGVSTVNPSMAVYNADTGEKLAWGNDFIFSNDPFIVLDLNVWQRYIVAIADHEENSTGDVSLLVSTPEFAVESTVAVDPTTGDGLFAGTINVNGDTDYYEFVAPANATSLDLTLTPAAALDGVVVLWGPDGNEIMRADLGGTGGVETLTYNGVTPGTQYLASVFSNQYASAAPFTLAIDFDIPAMGDFDADGDYDCTDIDSLVSAIALGTHNLAYDMNGDLAVDGADLAEWLTVAGAANLTSGNSYLLGDANLDGFVDDADFWIWNSNKFSSGAGWCGADFNADGQTNGRDFLIWNSNKLMSALVSRPPSEAAEPMASRHGDVAAIELAGAIQATPLQMRTVGDWTPARTGASASPEGKFEELIDRLFADQGLTTELA